MAALVACVGGCKPPPFAHQQADLMREPPPMLPGDVRSFWNDRATATYGELIVGSGQYQNAGRACRAARVTSINEASGVSEDRTLLYCQTPAGGFALDPSLSCRSTADGANLACRGPEGDDVTLPRT